MSTHNYLRNADVIGKSIPKIWYLDKAKTGRFQDRRIWVELDTGLGFDLSEILQRTPEGVSLLRATIWEPSMYCSESQEREPRLRGKILAVCKSELWLGFGLLLDTGFFVTTGASDWDFSVGFYRATEDQEAVELLLPP